MPTGNTTMETAERDRFIAEKLNQGMSLSNVQKLLAEQNVNMTYLELRLLAADLDIDWEKQESNKPDATPNVDLSAIPEESSGTLGQTTVNVHKVVRPGAAMSGDVAFASGAKGEWYLDNYGRLGINPADGSPKPTEQDIREFQDQLRQQLSG